MIELSAPRKKAQYLIKGYNETANIGEFVLYCISRDRRQLFTREQLAIIWHALDAIYDEASPDATDGN